MIARRNEEKTCDEIVLMLLIFKQFNKSLQKAITQFFYKMNNSNPQAFNSFPLFNKYYLPNQNEINLILNELYRQ